MADVFIPPTHGTAPWPVGNIQHWEETGARLESAIAAYLHSCMALEKSTSTTSIGIDNLPARLDRRIEYFHTLLTQPLALSLASVARTRNKLITSIRRIPPEILGKIFEFVVDLVDDELPMTRAIEDIGLSLHRILSVCSIWRKVGIAHTPLWTLVPLIHRFKRPPHLTEKSASLSLERSGRSELRLVADMRRTTVVGSLIGNKLVDQGSRFRSANLRASFLPALELILAPVLDTASPSSIAELSLCLEPTRDDENELTGPQRLFQTHFTSRQTAFESVLNTLRVLRLKNVHPNLANTSLSNLVELRIQEVTFGPDAALREFLWALGTASQLETLDIISATAHEMQVSPIPTHSTSFLLPSLRTLFLEGLTRNVLQTVLEAIRPGVHRTVLSLTVEGLYTSRPEGEIETGIDALQTTIQFYSFDTLVLGELWDGPDVDTLNSLSVMPTLTTIYLDEQTLDRDSLIGLTRSPEFTSQISFPQLRRIYISCCIIHDIGDQTALKDMLSSHPLEELVLGGTFSEVIEIIEPGNASNGDLEQVDIAGPDVRTISFKTWAQENVPKFTLLGRLEHMMFTSKEWKLW